MAEAKTKPTNVRVADFIAGVENETRRADARALVKLFTAATGERPIVWGPSIIGFGRHAYTYESGRSGVMCAVAFAPRKSALVLYLGGFPERAALLKTLGKHKTGAGCIYVNKLTDIDQGVLAEMVRRSMAQRAPRPSRSRDRASRRS